MGTKKRKVLRARTMIELLCNIYTAEGWRRAEGESRAKRTQEVYTITADVRNDRYVATPKEPS